MQLKVIDLLLLKDKDNLSALLWFKNGNIKLNDIGKYMFYKKGLFMTIYFEKIEV